MNQALLHTDTLSLSALNTRPTHSVSAGSTVCKTSKHMFFSSHLTPYYYLGSQHHKRLIDFKRIHMSPHVDTIRTPSAQCALATELDVQKIYAECVCRCAHTRKHMLEYTRRFSVNTCSSNTCTRTLSHSTKLTACTKHAARSAQLASTLKGNPRLHAHPLTHSVLLWREKLAC